MNSNYIYTDGLDSTVLVYYYETLRNKLSTIVSYLNKSIKSLDDLDLKISSCYTIDEEKVNAVLLEDLKNSLVDRVNYLNYTVIPSLNSKIDSLY